MTGFEEQEYQKPFDLKVWRELWPFVSPNRRNLLAAIGFILLSAVADILLPLFQRYAIDNFIVAGDLATLTPYTVVYVVCTILQTLLVVLFAYQSLYVEMSVSRLLKRTMFEHLQTLSFSYYNTTPVGYILARIMSDTDRISATIAWGLVDMMWALMYVIGVFIAMYLLNPQLALLVMLVVPFIAVLTWFFQRRILAWNRRVRRANSRITGGFNEGIMGSNTSKTLVIEDQNSRGFAKITGDMRTAALRAARLNAIYVPSIMFFSTFVTAAVLTRGGQFVMADVIQIGTLSAFTSYAIGIFEPIQQLARLSAELISSQANIERITDLLHRKPDITDTPEVIEKYGDFLSPKMENWEPLVGDIEFRDVTFRYPDGGENIFENFNLKVPAGTTVAIVGETGAGKSTLVNLACRFFEPTGGQILIDGRDYRERSQLWLHANLGYVLQAPHLFSGSILENIRYGRLDATDDEVIAAAVSVSADKAVEKLPDGYQSDVGEGGDKLSTGEKQLISFARAVLADPRIFVLDEATSSIDTHTEQLIQNAIAYLLGGRTSFIIAHRLSTIRQADIILVVESGKIIEQGTHAELLKKRGSYYELYSRQYEEESAERLYRMRNPRAEQ